MNFSFSISSKSQSSRLKKPSASFSASADHQEITSAADDSSARSYVREFNPDEAPQLVKPIAPIPNKWRPTKKLKNLPNLPLLSQTGSDSSLQFELDPGSNPQVTDNSVAYGLNLRQPPAAKGGLNTPVRRETISELELRNFREDLKKLPDDIDMDEFTDVTVEGFAAALMSGYGWKEGQGIGLNAKEDINVSEVIKKTGRGRLAFLHSWVGKKDRKRKRILIHERKAEKKRTKEIILLLFLMMW